MSDLDEFPERLKRQIAMQHLKLMEELLQRMKAIEEDVSEKLFDIDQKLYDVGHLKIDVEAISEAVRDIDKNVFNIDLKVPD